LNQSATEVGQLFGYPAPISLSRRFALKSGKSPAAWCNAGRDVLMSARDVLPLQSALATSTILSSDRD
jgi:hypothetical protein